MAHALTIITGVAGTTIAAQCNGADTGTKVESADVNVALQSVCNDMATVSTGNCTIAGNKTFSGSTTLSGGVAGNTTFGGDVHIAQTKSLTADGTGCTISGTWSQATTGKILLLGRKSLWRSRQNITDGVNRKIGVTTGTGINFYGDRFNLPGMTAAKRTIILDSTVNVPAEGEILSFFCQPSGLTIAGGVAFEFQRDDSSIAAKVYWDTGNVPTQAGADSFWLTFEYTGGAWTLAENSGSTSDATNTYYVGVRLA